MNSKVSGWHLSKTSLCGMTWQRKDVTCKYRVGMPAKISAYHKVTLRPDDLILF